MKDCSAQVEHNFLALGYRLDGKQDSPMADYWSHYDPRRQRCFSLITTTTLGNGSSLTTKLLTDAFDGKDYAGYSWASDKVKKYWEVPPMECYWLDEAAKKVVCKSSDEFNEGVKQYMERPKETLPVMNAKMR